MPEYSEVHARREELAALAAGTLTPAARRRVVRHLLSGCEACRKVANEEWYPSFTGTCRRMAKDIGEPQEHHLDSSLDRVLETVKERRKALARERSEAPRLWSEIEGLTLAQKRLLVANEKRYQTLSFTRLVAERAQSAGFDNPTQAIELAELAIFVSERVDPGEVGVRSAHDLLAHCWSTLGNARRIVGDLEGALEALGIASEWLSEGTGDPLEEARYLDFLADTRRSQRRFQESLALRSRVASLYQRIGDDHLRGRTLVAQAKTLDDMQEPGRSVDTLKVAIPLLDPDREPLVVLAAHHNLALSLNELGRSEEALALVRRARPLYRQVGGALNQLRLRWLEGKIERERGRHLAACRALLEVRGGFLERDMGYEAALVTLDLALTHLEAGNHAEVRRLAIEAIPVFESLGIRREAFAALLALREAAQRELVTGAFLSELYQRATHIPASTG